MVQVEPKELRGDGVSFDLVEGGQSGDEKVEVVAILVFDTKIVDD
jgi:hypothetical protein